IGPDPRNFNQRVSLGRNDLLIRTFPKEITPSLAIKLIEFSISLVPFYNSPHSCLLFFYT
ncbi:hypothetical protein ACH656_00500, partial [Klebsiella pneumoniae]